MFVVQNKNLFWTNIENCNIDTRQRNNLYLSQANLTMYQKGAYYSGINIFNNLPMEIHNVASNLKKFKIALRQFLYLFILYIGRIFYSIINYVLYYKNYYIGTGFEVLSYGTLHKYSMIVCNELISFPCLNLMSYVQYL